MTNDNKIKDEVLQQAVRDAIDVFALAFCDEVLANDDAFWANMRGLFQSRARTMMSDD